MSRIDDLVNGIYPLEDSNDSNTICKRVGFRQGYEQAEKDVMEKAIEVEVFDDWQYGKDADRIAQPSIKLRCPELKIGQKVKVIIIKD